MEYKNIKFDIKDQVGRIILNRPRKLNSITKEMSAEVQDALDQCKKDKTIRAVYLTGTGRAFCSGQDLAEAIDDQAPSIREIVKNHYNPIITRLREIEKPVVCAVNGVAAGAGANIAFACDITFAAKSVEFIQSFSQIGLVPDSGGTFTLPRLIGMQKAAGIMMLAEPIKARQADELGMIYKMVVNDKLEKEAFGTAKKLAHMPTKGLGLTKRLLNESMKNNLREQLNLEEEMQAAAGETHDYQEGVNSFLEKREPEFKGE